MKRATVCQGGAWMERLTSLIIRCESCGAIVAMGG